MLVFPKLVQQGKVPNVDFLHLYGPTSLDVLALWYRAFGDSLESQRTFGLLQHLGIIFAIYALARAAGHLAATGAALVATVLIMTPIGLSALAWHGAVALGLWALVFAVRASVRVDSARDWWFAGGLAGLALGFRPDLGGRARPCARLRDLAAAGDVPVPPARRRGGLAPDVVAPDRAGPVNAIEGMLLDPVVRLRPGRELPRPPSWGVVDGALQAVAEGVPPYWPLPAPAASQQLFLWFFAVVIIADRRARARVARPSAHRRRLVTGHLDADGRRTVRARHPAAGAPASRLHASRVGGGRVVAAAGADDRHSPPGGSVVDAGALDRGHGARGAADARGLPLLHVPPPPAAHPGVDRRPAAAVPGRA